MEGKDKIYNCYEKKNGDNYDDTIAELKKNNDYKTNSSYNYEITSFFFVGRFFKIPFNMTVIRMMIEPT